MIPCMPVPWMRGILSVVPRRISVKVDPSRVYDRTTPRNLASLIYRMPLVSSLIIFTSSIPMSYQVKPLPPAPREKTFLKPPPPTMPGSLFPRSPSMVPDFGPSLQTPRIHGISNGASSPTLGTIDAKRTEVHPTAEDNHAEADISSGALARSAGREFFSFFAARGRCSVPAQALG